MGYVLYLQVYLLRFYMRINSWLDRFFTAPIPLRPAFTTRIPATVSPRPGSIILDVYLPRGHTRASIARAGTKKEWPVIVNFHGSGFVLGQPTDDSRFATTLLDQLDAVFVAVGYRLGPEHPQPTAIEDGVDALRWVWAHAEDWGCDPERVVITGFSAGGNMAFSVPLRHHRMRGSDTAAPRLAGIVTFYPSVNHAIPRAVKAESNPASKLRGKEPAWMHRMIDQAYYRDLPPEGLAAVDFSPALAPRDHLVDGLPDRVAIFTCGFDKLLVEAEDFRVALKALGKTVGGEKIENVPHAFDKKRVKYVEERDYMYEEAVKQIKSMV